MWLIYLEGGLWCYDEPSCRVRAQQTPFYVSSVHWPIVQSLGGIFDDDPKRNPLARAHKVYVGYCSSDAWSGNIGAADVSFGFNFRGQHNIAATIATLQAEAGLGASANTRVLFGGCSAGARGAMFNLDYVGQYLPATAQLLGFLDSPMWVDIEPLDPSTESLINQTQLIVPLVNATGRIGPLCAAAYPDPSDHWRCFFGEFRLPYITTPYLLSASQFDKYQLPYNEGSPPPYQGQQLAYADEFQALVRSTMLNLPTPNQPDSAVFSSACFKHCTSNIPSFYGVQVGGVSLKDVLRDWYFGTWANGVPGNSLFSPSTKVPPAPQQTIESCTGFGCGACHNRSKTYTGQQPPMPPLPPAHTADLTVTATGAPMMRTPPPPAAPNAAEAALTAAMASARANTHPQVRAYAEQARTSSYTKHVGRLVLIAIAAALACSLCEFCCSARRNYRPPPRPVPSTGSFYSGASDAGSGISIAESGAIKLGSWPARGGAGDIKEAELAVDPTRYAGVAPPPRR